MKVWSALDGRLLATLRGAGAEITDVCASADGALLACGSVERLVRVWCLASGAPRAVLAAHAGECRLGYDGGWCRCVTPGGKGGCVPVLDARRGTRVSAN